MKKICVLALFIVTMLCGCSTYKQAEDVNIEQKVGQLFMVHCTPGKMDEILAKNPGGILMFGTDFKDLTREEIKKKIASYQEKSKIPLFIAVDEEGGAVVRVSSNKNICDEKYKSPREYYLEGGLGLIAQNTAEKSRLLAELGINMNLAPVADVSVNEEDFIYDRTLGEDAETTATYVSEVVWMMSQNGMASCLKHFPGYGSNVDTHTGIAVDERPLSEFENSDFLPFVSGINAGADAVLVSHNIVTTIDSTQPASISPDVHNILREKLGFGGIIMTDDMTMGAMKDYGNPYVKAVLAGNDLVMVSDFETAYNEVLEAVKRGEIPEELIDEAYNRIINKKKELFK